MAIRQRIISRSGVISAIEIAYFRSFYKVHFETLDRLNIFFGENDTGKSNVMRALNLFFNGVIDDLYEFDFDIDFSSKRASEAQGAVDVRKFSYVKIWFRTPAVHKQALGEEFYVKRTWSQSTIPDYRQEQSRHIDTSGKRQSLTKFLDKISFTYIPAVKSHDVYSSLLKDAYSAISQSDAFSNALRTFTDEIRNQTADLSTSLNRSLGMSSDLAPPTDLAELFGTLDFQTLALGGDQMSLLRQRGDGVQARHIPEIMSFISEKDSHQFHIWGIEEPENSLSINSSILLADRLKDIAQSGHIQLFLTTHSPSFYSLEGRGVRKVFLRAGAVDVESIDGSNVDTRKLMEFMGDRFYLPLVAKGVQEAKEKADNLEDTVNTLKAQIVIRDRPILFVEGPSDETLIKRLLEKTNQNEQIDVIPLGSATHADRFAGMTEELIKRILGARKGYILLDSDKAGRKPLPNKINPEHAKTKWIKSQNSIKWRLIPVSAEANAAFDAAGVIGREKQGACLEDCYSAATRQSALDAGTYALGQPREIAHQGDLFAISDALKDDSHKFYLIRPSESHKTRFIEWLIQQNREECPSIRAILDELIADCTVDS